MSRREQALSPKKEWEVEGGGGSLFWEGGEKGRSEGGSILREGGKEEACFCATEAHALFTGKRRPAAMPIVDWLQA